MLLIKVIACLEVNAQQVVIEASNKPLNEVLVEMGENYDVQFSFNDRLLSQCFISDNQTYDSPKLAIKSLVKKCQFTFQINEGVFVIYASSAEKKKTDIKRIKGRIVDQSNNEPLPFSNIQINSTLITTDVGGNFSFKSRDSVNHIKASHVGYYLMDTMIFGNDKLVLKLAPSVIGLEEFIIEANAEIQTAHIGKLPGLAKVNAKVASFLPGNRANTVFNILRLQPGVLAAGEEANDYMVWGSYKGQTQLIFDGITLFNGGSSNDNIGAINPFIVKDVEIYKGGYNVHLGDRTGGVVNITGASGDNKKIGAQLSVDNQLVNTAVNVPLGKKNTMQLMFRKSYADVFDTGENANKKESSYTIDQQFTDVNFKINGSGNNGDQYYVSLLGNKDDVVYNIVDEKNDLFSRYRKSDQQQLGAAFFYGKSWKSRGTTNFTLAHSNLEINSSDSRQYSDGLKTARSEIISSDVNNGILESSLKIAHYFPASNKQSWLLGMGLINNETRFSNEEKFSGETVNRVNGYLKNNITVSKAISIEPGVRLDVPLNSKKVYVQPRINLILKPFENWKVNLATGRYDQFVVENPIFDSIGNNYYSWGIADDLFLPVVRGLHYVAGLTYSKHNMVISVEGFYKTNSNLSRFSDDYKSSYLTIVYGENRSTGLDFYCKKKIGKHQFWLAYTISKTTELFTNFKVQEYQLAPHDQRHELKGAGIINFNPVYFSMNYVYGSGLMNSEQLATSNKIIPYSRFDVALLYRFKAKKYKLETGISVLNVLNTFNVRYNNFSNFPNGETVYQQALPFTPTLMLKFGF